MMMLMISLNLIFSLIFLFLNHPMSMGLILMIQTIMISMILNMFSYSSWFSYMLFLVMVGGMLILFLYMTSLASNEKFKLSSKMTIYLLFILLIMLSLMMIDPMIINMMTKTSNNIEMINNLINNENLKTLNLMYNKPNYIITIMMINYLLITLIAVVKITKFNHGPLRQKF